MQLLEGRKAVVTGGSRGIGREICLLLAENGADVALAYRKSTVEAEQLREEITAMGRSCIAVQADVSVSACTAMQLRPIAAISSRSCSASTALFRYASATSAPFSASSRQISRPMPLEPPVTTALRPSNSCISQFPPA